MNDRLKEAFESVQAESGLKNRTKEFLFQKTNGYKRVRTVNRMRLISAFACMAFLLIGGHWLYFTPTVKISMDINPSVELGVNRFDRIISLESRNDDGRELLNSLDVKYRSYSEAVNRIMENEAIAALLSDGEIMTIAVIGADDAQSKSILSHIQSCTAGKDNTYCCYAHSEEVEQAHQAGLSCGKYKAFLELQELKPDITVDEIRNMTMREIRDMISELSDGGENQQDHLENDSGHWGNHNHQHRKRRQGKM